MPVFTPKKNLQKPLVNDPADANLWGYELNDNADVLENNEALEQSVLSTRDRVGLMGC